MVPRLVTVTTPDRAPAPAPTHPVAVLTDAVLTEDEARYVEAARAANTVRGYRADWTDFTTWCHTTGHPPLPADPAAITGYLTTLAARGLKVGTLSRRLSAITFAHAVHDMADPTTGARVLAVWEGIRRTHTTPPVQATPMMPPLLHDVLDACPLTPDVDHPRPRPRTRPGWTAATAPYSSSASSPPYGAANSPPSTSTTSVSTPKASSRPSAGPRPTKPAPTRNWSSSRTAPTPGAAPSPP